jgi:hypothetical protein
MSRYIFKSLANKRGFEQLILAQISLIKAKNKTGSKVQTCGTSDDNKTNDGIWLCLSNIDLMLN